MKTRLECAFAQNSINYDIKVGLIIANFRMTTMKQIIRDNMYYCQLK